MFGAVALYMIYMYMRDSGPSKGNQTATASPSRPPSDEFAHDSKQKITNEFDDEFSRDSTDTFDDDFDEEFDEFSGAPTPQRLKEPQAPHIMGDSSHDILIRFCTS